MKNEGRPGSRSESRDGRTARGETPVKKFHYLHAFPRRISGFPLLVRLGHWRSKTEILDRFVMDTNVCFVFAGEGFQEVDGVRTALKAPFVLVQRPGFFYRHGPTTEKWHEVYLKFSQASIGLAERWGLATTHHFSMSNAPRCLELLRRMEELCGRAGLPGTADQIDRYAEIVLLEAMEKRAGRSLDPRIPGIEERMKAWMGRKFSWSDFAKAEGLSRRTLFRLVQENLHMSPGDFLEVRRMEEAERLLSKHRSGIAEIAYRVGFTSPLYFSTRFRRRFGVSPREYRDKVAPVGPDRGGAPR